MLQVAILVALFAAVAIAIVLWQRQRRATRSEAVQRVAATLGIPWQPSESPDLTQQLGRFELFRGQRLYPHGWGQGSHNRVPFRLSAYDYTDFQDMTYEWLILDLSPSRGCVPFYLPRARPLIDRGESLERVAGYDHLKGSYRLEASNPAALGHLLPYINQLVGRGTQPQMECDGQRLIYVEEVPSAALTSERMQTFIESGFGAVEALGVALK